MSNAGVIVDAAEPESVKHARKNSAAKPQRVNCTKYFKCQMAPDNLYSENKDKSVIQSH
jgi:hypothetical protein